MATQIITYNTQGNPQPTPFYGLVTKTNCLQVLGSAPVGGIYENECACLEYCLPAFETDKGTFIYQSGNLATVLQRQDSAGWVDIGMAGVLIESGFATANVKVVTFDFSIISSTYGFAKFRLKIGSGDSAMYSQSFCVQNSANCNTDGTVYIVGKLKGLVGNPNNQRSEIEFDREITVYYRCYGKLFEQPVTSEQTNIFYAQGQIVSENRLHTERVVVPYKLELYQILLFNVRNIYMYALKDCIVFDSNFKNYSFNVLNGVELVKQDGYTFDLSAAPYTFVLPNATIGLRNKYDNLTTLQ